MSALHNNVWVRVAGVSGAVAVGLGAMGAHAFKNQSEHMKDTWRVASQYHFIHTLALSMCALTLTGKKRNYVCGLFTAGMALFSGACYTIVLMDQRKPFTYFAPVGGLLMMAGWGALAIL
jgi:uncharacterized membrane protein YgdD (TMEM256/DUF423 family)|eukprot:gene5952-4276_t